jgi:hypothetical protein
MIKRILNMIFFLINILYSIFYDTRLFSAKLTASYRQVFFILILRNNRKKHLKISCDQVLILL